MLDFVHGHSLGFLVLVYASGEKTAPVVARVFENTSGGVC